ncbi:MAG: DUF4831 family protein [Bacteroidales bacterium]|mgnify:CR=1 FL=1|nr:DUF4831 family protein [Bacteroidales bacterium]MBQ8574291.1 DUF4831 family protein [Bacteroidales bacterium]
MKMKLMTALAFAFALVQMTASAQTGSDPTGYVTYSLPQTVLSLEVEAVRETFYAGPYAKYAEKYLGIKPRMKDENSVQLTELKMTPLVEADQNSRYSVNIKKGTLNPSVFTLSAAGLVTFSDAEFGDASVWRFPVKSEGDFSGKGVSSNLTSEATTLYRNEKKESAYNRVSVQQNMVVEKSLEQKAAETANTILDLRRQRLQIVTGDTDATYSGEAMGAAIEELTRLEQEYMTLFTGYSDYQTQKMRFDVIPEAGRENQMYIAFRISDKSGLVPADDMSGKPVVMEIVPQAIAQTELRNSASNVIHYRIPAICTVKLKNGADLLLQSRIPVYQLGQESSLPAAVGIIK